MTSLNYLFKPKSIAIIGASDKMFTISYQILQNLKSYNFKGKIFLVNPKKEHIDDIKVYKSILDIEDNVDMAHIVIKNTLVPQTLEECAKKNVKTVVINTSGFKEIGKEGAELEKEIVKIAKRTGMRIFGPNCQGVMNTDENISLYSNFTFTRIKKGHISIIAQGGGVGEIINNRIAEMGIGIRMYASNGNACDISIPEIIEYYGNDKGTKVIIVQLETLPNPKEFIETAKKITPYKPILAIKSGTTEEGAKAASSHTGGLIKQDKTIDVVFDKCSVLRFNSILELCDAASCFALQPIPKGNRVGIITNTGSPAIISTDECIKAGVVLPPLSDNTKKTLKETLFATSSVANPLDMMATAGDKEYGIAIDNLLNEDIDSLLIHFVTPFFIDCEKVAREIAMVCSSEKAKTKTITSVIMTDWAGKKWENTVKILRDANIPVFAFPESAAKSIVSMVEYLKLKSRKRTKYTKSTVNKNLAEEILKNKNGFLSYYNIVKLLSAYNIPAVQTEFFTEKEEGIHKANKLGYPIVLKVDSDKIIHKTEKQAVVLNIKNKEELINEFDKLKSRLNLSDAGYYIQRYIPSDREVIIGAKREENIGHIIMFGMGGIYVEVLKDVSFKLAPLSKEECYEMIHSIKTYPLLKGIRNTKGVYIKGIEEMLIKVSQLVSDFPQIEELDLNPVLTFEKGVFVADVRIKITGGKK